MSDKVMTTIFCMGSMIKSTRATAISLVHRGSGGFEIQKKCLAISYYQKPRAKSFVRVCVYIYPSYQHIILRNVSNLAELAYE